MFIFIFYIDLNNIFLIYAIRESIILTIKISFVVNLERRIKNGKYSR